jgi:hypothetical protein
VKRGKAGLALVFLVILAGCVSTAPSPEATAPTLANACELVTNMDTLVGKTAVGPPGGFRLNEVDRCIWTYAADPARSVGVSVAPLIAHGAAIESFGEGETIPGLGENARWWAANHLLSVAAEDEALQVDLQLDAEGNSKELAVSIAQAALQNLH